MSIKERIIYTKNGEPKTVYEVRVQYLENSGHFGHPFRMIPDTNSGLIRTVIPV